MERTANSVSEVGVALDASAGERPKGRKVISLAGLIPFLKPYWPVVLGAAIALVTAAGAVLAIGQAVRRVLDHGFENGGGLIDLYFLALMGVVAVLAVATFARYYCVTWLGERMVADLRQAVYAHVITLSPSFYEVTKTGEVLSRLTADTTLIQSVVGSTASVAMRNVLLFIGGTVLMLISSPKLTGMVFLILPVVLAPILIFGRRVRKLSRDSQDRIADVSAQAEESLSALQVLQAFCHEALARARFQELTRSAFATAIARVRARAWLTALVMLLIFGAVDAVVWIGARDVAAGIMTGGELAAFVFYAIVVAGALGALSEVYGELQRAAGALERLLEILAIEPDIRAPASPEPLPRQTTNDSRLQFKDVTFHYPSRPDQPALENFTLDVAPGETLALVGPSGAGKSTVFQLLLRFFDPESGGIFLDGVNIQNADPTDVRSLLGVVAQEPVIFGATAAENIRYGRPGASDADVHKAAEAAHALDFLQALPEGLDTFLGERGVRLSGGQRQRIAIARAILRDPHILLLDEATSALDAESERVVQAALDDLMKERTTLVIAHRLSTVLKADRIVVLDHGRIVEQGRHEDLAAAGGLYAHLAALQFQNA